MTKKNLTLIGILVDRSGSMNSCRSDMEGGIRSLLDKQVDEPVTTEVTLAQFDTTYDLVYPITPLSEIPDYVLIPRGGTALLDGVGRFVTSVGEDLAKRKESKRPSKVLIVIVTDGYENSSKEYTANGVKALIEQQKDDYDWDFVFLGADIDAVATAEGMGISRGSALTFSRHNAPGVFTSSVGNYVSSYNTVGRAAFTAEDREDALADKSTP